METKNEKPVSETIPKSLRGSFKATAEDYVSPQQAYTNAECRHPRAPRVDASDWVHGIGLN